MAGASSMPARWPCASRAGTRPRAGRRRELAAFDQLHGASAGDGLGHRGDPRHGVGVMSAASPRMRLPKPASWVVPLASVAADHAPHRRRGSRRRSDLSALGFCSRPPGFVRAFLRHADQGPACPAQFIVDGGLARSRATQARSCRAPAISLRLHPVRARQPGFAIVRPRLAGLGVEQPDASPPVSLVGGCGRPSRCEMLHAHRQIARPPAGIAQSRRADGPFFRAVSIVFFSALTTTSGSLYWPVLPMLIGVEAAELHTMSMPGTFRDGLEVVDARFLLDHDGDDDLVQRRHRQACRLRGPCRHRHMPTPSGLGRGRRAPSSSRRARRRPQASSTVRMSANSTLWKARSRSPAWPGGCIGSARIMPSCRPCSSVRRNGRDCQIVHGGDTRR